MNEKLQVQQQDKIDLTQLKQGGFYCVPTAEGHCATCSDEALAARVLQIDEETGLALVTIEDITEEIDVTLVEGVVPGDMVLVHGGVAIGQL